MRSDKEILEEKHKKWGTEAIVRKQDLMIELLLDIRKMLAYHVTSEFHKPLVNAEKFKIYTEIEGILKEQINLENKSKETQE